MQEEFNKIKGHSLGFLNEFRQFAIKGNVVDLAVGLIIGTAFGKIVSSLVADVVMPPIGFLVGGVNFTHLVFQLKDPTSTLAPVDVKYGQFLQTVVDFTIVALSVFLMVKVINHVRIKMDAQTPTPPPPAPSEQEKLLREIRDLLASQKK